MPSIFEEQFRDPGAYIQLTEKFLAEFALANNLKATDLVVMATIIGIMGTAPIRKNLKVSEMSEALINYGMDVGKAVFKKFQQRMKRQGRKSSVIH